MKRILILAPLLLASLAHADGNVYRAVIDGRINALITAKSDGGRYRGRILYDASGAGGLSLEGKAAENGGFEWKEMLWSRAEDKTSQTGLYTGRLAPDGKSGEGAWQSADGRKNLPFALTRIAKIETLADKEVDARVDYPQLDDPRFARINAQLAAEARKELDGHIRSVRKMREELKDIGTAALDHLSASTSCDIESATPQAVSLLCTRYEYSGGAHGNTGLDGRNYLLAEDGAVKPLGLWHMLRKSPANEKKLSDLIVAELKRQKASSVADGSIKGFVKELDKEELPFTLLPNGLAFHFEPYDVGVYAEGSFRAVIPNRALAPLFRLEKNGGGQPRP
jgi:hypothetical protein